MTPRANFLTYWYYHIADLVLAALIYLLLARLLVALIWGADSDKLMVRVLERVTDPVLESVAAITPRAVPRGLVIAFAVVWLVVARLALFIAVTARGVRLTLG